MKDAVRLVIRTEGGQRIGFGHVRRCLSLAAALRQRGAEVVFLSNPDPTVINQVVKSGFKVIPIDPLADPKESVEQSLRHRARIIVVDSYNFQTDSFRSLMDAVPFVVALDDLAAIDLPVHMVINGSVGAERLAYRGAKKTRFILGPQYILLRPEFAQLSRRSVMEQVGSVVITVGGSDPNNLTPRLIAWTSSALGAVRVDVIVGPLFENIEEIKAATHGKSSVVLHDNPEDIRSLMLAADLAISGGGQTTYELAATGTPTIGIRLFRNQTINLRGLSENGALIWAGDAEDPDLADKVTGRLLELGSAPSSRTVMSERGRSLVDGQGSARTAAAILELASVS